MSQPLPWDSSTLLQNIGIIVGLWFTAQSFRQNSKDRQLDNLLKMAERSDALWEKVENDPKLQRVLAYKADMTQPATLAEVEALSKIFKLFQDGWRVASATDKEELESLAYDIADFLQRPLPHAIWEQKKVFRNRRFVRFVNRALEAAEPLRQPSP